PDVVALDDVAGRAGVGDADVDGLVSGHHVPRARRRATDDVLRRAGGDGDAVAPVRERGLPVGVEPDPVAGDDVVLRAGELEPDAPGDVPGDDVAGGGDHPADRVPPRAGG